MTHLCCVLLNSCEFSYAFSATLGFTLTQAGSPCYRVSSSMPVPSPGSSDAFARAG